MGTGIWNIWDLVCWYCILGHWLHDVLLLHFETFLIFFVNETPDEVRLETILSLSAPPNPIVESSIEDAVVVDEVLVDEEPVPVRVEQAKKRRRPKLVDSLGYS